MPICAHGQSVSDLKNRCEWTSPNTHREYIEDPVPSKPAGRKPANAARKGT